MAWPIMRGYIELTKPRITWLILMSTGIGYFFGLPGAARWWEFLRSIAHLRPRSNLFGAVFRMRSRLAFAVHLR